MIQITKLSTTDFHSGGFVVADEGSVQLRLDAAMSDAFLQDQPLGLTQREYQLLSVLMDHPNQMVPNDRLLEALWGTATVGDDHPVHVNISRLRAKLGEDRESASLIRTIRGRGYVYAPATPAAHVVHLLYDHRLILRSVEPADRPFLGWHPGEVVDTFFLLTAHTAVNSNRHLALALVKAFAGLGLVRNNGVADMRCADGTNRPVQHSWELLTLGRRFTGMKGTIDL